MAKRILLGALSLTLCAAVLGDAVKQMEAKEGQNVELPCNYRSAHPDPRIEWKLNSGQDTSLIYYGGSVTTSFKDRAEYFPQGLLLKGVTRKDAGEYVCEVIDITNDKPVATYYRTQLTVLVPPSVPVAQVPKSVTIGSSTILRCLESDASPRPTITWFKNKIQLPQDPKSSPSFQNATYVIDPATGDLTFNPVTQTESGEYFCVATNSQGKQTSGVVFMEAYEKNVGGIVAAVIIVLLILGLIAFGVWFAYSRGYIGKKASKKVIYSQPSETRSDKNFQQTSSFVV